jgi:hypothetical protein
MQERSFGRAAHKDVICLQGNITGLIIPFPEEDAMIKAAS